MERCQHHLNTLCKHCVIMQALMEPPGWHGADGAKKKDVRVYINKTATQHRV